MAARQPGLAQCHPISFATALINCCSLGLEPNTSLGEAYLVPFKNKGQYECTLIIGYRGYIELAYRSGQVDWLYATCVYKADHFRYRLGSQPFIDHEPDLAAIDRGPIICAYAMCKMKDCAEPIFRVVGKAELDGARAQSQTGRFGRGPWLDHYDEMCCKTAIRRLWKFLPLSSEDQRLRRLEDVETAAEMGGTASTGIETLDNRAELELNDTQADRLEQQIHEERDVEEAPAEHPVPPAADDPGEAPDADGEADHEPAENTPAPPQATISEMREKSLKEATVAVTVTKLVKPQSSAKYIVAHLQDKSGACNARVDTNFKANIGEGEELTVVLQRKTWGERSWLQIVDILE
jgi:phage RecT family recombinase